MHELSIAMNILEGAEEEMKRKAYKRVVAIHLRIGVMAGVEKDALEGAFEIARTSTPFERCKLVIEMVPVSIYCAKCEGERSIVSMQDMRCSVCGEPARKILKGRELELSAMEVEP